VAMIANVNYKQALKKMPDCRDGTTIEQLKKGLRSFKVKFRHLQYAHGKKYRSFKFDAILRGNVPGDTHWVVWDHNNKKKHDPWPGKKPLRFQCTSFVRITARNSN
jgi:hypothetical protein